MTTLINILKAIIVIILCFLAVLGIPRAIEIISKIM